MSNTHTARVEVLTAEVRCLMVGSRQVTLSVFRQLDTVSPGAIEPFGRVRADRDISSKDDKGFSRIDVIGKDKHTGELVRSFCSPPYRELIQHEVWDRSGKLVENPNLEKLYARANEKARVLTEWATLPLIVLAGLK